MADFTPGPWEVGEPNQGGSVLAVGVFSDRWHIADVWRDVPELVEEAEANARLIAAAPDLLAALKRSLDWLASYQGAGADRVWEQAKAAIAKAEGATHG
jgi:hypothetical protein